jgi:hypothetical protein
VYWKRQNSFLKTEHPIPQGMIGQILSPIAFSKYPAKMVPDSPNRTEILEPNRKAIGICSKYKNKLPNKNS